MDVAASNLAPPTIPSQNLELARHAELLQSFCSIPSIDRAWAIASQNARGTDVVVAMSQVNLPANKKRSFLSNLYVPDAEEESVRWSPFPVELTGAALVVPSPSGAKVLVVYNPESRDSTPTVRLQVWGTFQLQKEIHVSAKVHGSVYADGWFEGVSWSPDESCISYIAEEPAPSKPAFGAFQADGPGDESEAGSWKGQGDWLEDWGECYSGKRRPTIFVVDVNSSTVEAVEGIPKDLSAGQVVWAPPPAENKDSQPLVFVGWTSHAENFRTPRKLGMKYCYNRPCALYAVEAPRSGSTQSSSPLALTASINSAFSPRFSPDGKLLIFLSAKAAVDSGAHAATNSLHCIQWQGIPGSSNLEIRDIVPVLMRPDERGFPGLYCSGLLPHPWGYSETLFLSSVWRSSHVILSINVESGEISRLSPEDSTDSWSLLSVKDSLMVAVCSNAATPPYLKTGRVLADGQIKWSDIAMPMRHSEKVEDVLSAISTQILQIPIPLLDQSSFLPSGAKKPFEAFLVSPGSEEQEPAPLIVVLHGGPHSTSVIGFSRNAAYLSALGFSLLHVNYRGSLGFGEEAVQCLLGKAGDRDVNDVLAALDTVIAKGLARPDKVAVLGGSHGGFLSSHLIGQAPDRFVTAVMRNPVCNISSMVGICDIPDWCYMESYGKPGLSLYSEAPSSAQLETFYRCSPIAHVDKVKVPTLFLLGAQDRRVPVSNGLQYAQALRARGLEVKIIVFPEDVHAIDRPQSDFESFANAGAWFSRFLH